MRYRPGDTFLYRHPPYSDRLHLCIVLSDEYGEPPCVIVAPVTTYKKDSSETTAFLYPGDHDFIKHQSTMTYVHMISMYVGDIDVDNHGLYPSLRPGILARVLNGALKSDDAPKGLQRKLKELRTST